jgi:hypothetical protein
MVDKIEAKGAEPNQDQVATETKKKLDDVAERRLRFGIAIYEKARDIIQKNHSKFGEDALVKLAGECGGKALRRAVDAKAETPCTYPAICSECWMNKWCVHQEKSREVRLEKVTEIQEKKAEESKKASQAASKTASIAKSFNIDGDNGDVI